MSEYHLHSPILVDDQDGLRRMVEHLRARRLIALDTESDSLFSYYPKVCLIQVSAYADSDPSEVTDYLVDTLAIRDLAPLGALLSQPENEVVMHAADNDLLLLQREFAISISHVFDTQLAARILGRQSVGLAAILDEEFGVTSNKRMQRTNWSSRPLKTEQIVYAQKDTHYLLPLRRKLRAELQSAGHWEEAQEAFDLLVDADYDQKTAAERTVWSMKEARSVPRADTGVLEAVWEWREQEAQRRDTPPFKVLRNQVLVELAEQQPASVQELEQVQGIGRAGVQRYGKEILAAIQDGKQRPLPQLPEPTARPEYSLDKKVLARYDALRNWRTKTANKRNVAPDIVFANGTLLEIAKRGPKTMAQLLEIREIGPWKAKTYGPAILKIAAN